MDHQAEAERLKRELDLAQVAQERATASGKDTSERLKVKLDGKGQVKEVRVEKGAFGVKDPSELEKALGEALSEALAKLERKAQNRIGEILEG